MLWRPPAVIIVHQDLVGCLSYPSRIPSTRFSTGTVLVLPTPVEARPQYCYCEDSTLQNRPCVSSHFSSSGTRVSSDAGTFWNTGLDLNQRLLGFAIPCIGPLCHQCVVSIYMYYTQSSVVCQMVEVDGFEPPRSLGTQDLQSRAIDRYAIPPGLATRDGIEPPLEVLETSALPLY